MRPLKSWIQSLVAERTQPGVAVVGSRALTPEDNGKTLFVTHASGDITLTANIGLPDGFACEVVQLAAGTAQFAPGTMPVRHSFSFTRTRGIYAVASLRVVNGTAITAGDMKG